MRRVNAMGYYALVLLFCAWLWLFGAELPSAALYTLSGVVFLGFSILAFGRRGWLKVGLAGVRLKKAQAIAVILTVTVALDLFVYRPGVYVLLAQVVLLVVVIGHLLYRGSA